MWSRSHTSRSESSPKHMFVEEPMKPTHAIEELQMRVSDQSRPLEDALS